MNFRLRQPSGFWDWVIPEIIIRTDGESSIVALSRRVGEKLKEAGVKTMHNTSPAYDSRSAGHAESGISEREKFAR